MKKLRLCGTTAERVRHLFDYDPNTGIFTRLIRTSNNTNVGDVAGYRTGRGYIAIGIDGVYYLAHRVAFLWVTGEWPKDEIDHKDLDCANNKWDNLREATHAQNMTNIAKRVKNSSGFKNVSFSRQRKKWEAYTRHQHGGRLRIGFFDSPEVAYEAYLKKATELHGEFVRCA